MKVAVFGIGKIGLPLAVQFARKGHEVIGVDLDESVVDQVTSGEVPFPGEARLAEYLATVVAGGLLTATTDGARAVATADAVVVAVPLYVDKGGKPDFSAIDAVTAVIGDHVRLGALVSFETTLPVGTTRDRIAPEIARRSGLRPGEDVHLVFSPERVLTGRVFEDLRKYPKLVGGVSEASEGAGAVFYETVLDFDTRPDLRRPNGVWRMGSSEAAELAKLAETTYRDVNIALANQFALFAELLGLDVYKVIEACNSQPYSHIHSPGIAVGGHCIPVYPMLYLSGHPEASLVRAARKVNSTMPAWAVKRLRQEVGDLSGATVLILGVAYRGGVKESAYSGVFPLQRQLVELGARVVVHDPLYSDGELHELGLRPYEPGTPVDAIIVQAAHGQYAPWVYNWKPSPSVLLDGRAALIASDWPMSRIITLGVGHSP